LTVIVCAYFFNDLLAPFGSFSWLFEAIIDRADEIGPGVNQVQPPGIGDGNVVFADIQFLQHAVILPAAAGVIGGSDLRAVEYSPIHREGRRRVDLHRAMRQCGTELFDIGMGDVDLPTAFIGLPALVSKGVFYPAQHLLPAAGDIPWVTAEQNDRMCRNLSIRNGVIQLL